MSALTIAKADVLLVTGSAASNQVAGEPFEAGDEVYQAGNGRWFKAQCDGTALQAGARGTGMALATADVAGARVGIARPGSIVSVGTGEEGGVYCLGRTPGTLVPYFDVEVGDRVTIAALGIGSNKLMLCCVYHSDVTLSWMERPSMLAPELKTAAFVAEVGHFYACDTTEGSFTVTLPDDAENGDQVILEDPLGTWGVNSLAVTAVLVTIDGGVDPTFDTPERVTLILTADGWRTKETVPLFPLLP